MSEEYRSIVLKATIAKHAAIIAEIKQGPLDEAGKALVAEHEAAISVLEIEQAIKASKQDLTKGPSGQTLIYLLHNSYLAAFPQSPSDDELAEHIAKITARFDANGAAITPADRLVAYANRRTFKAHVANNSGLKVAR